VFSNEQTKNETVLTVSFLTFGVRP
jgi:hypothetical protein